LTLLHKQVKKHPPIGGCFCFPQHCRLKENVAGYHHMSVLIRSEIKKAIDSKDIVFNPPLDGFQLQPHAVDLRLGYKFLIPRNWTVDEKGRRAINVSIDDVEGHREQFDEVQLQPGQYFDLLPNEFVIATSLERIEINDMSLMAILFPRTSTNRRGIDLSLSGIIDTGYKGNLIFPMKNEAGNQVIRIYPGERICQVIFQRLSSSLTPEEANLHGMAAAKYTESGSQNFKLDKDNERKLLIEGKLDELKEQFGI
jgi:dCTP deaminase